MVASHGFLKYQFRGFVNFSPKVQSESSHQRNHPKPPFQRPRQRIPPFPSKLVRSQANHQFVKYCHTNTRFEWKPDLTRTHATAMLASRECMPNRIAPRRCSSLRMKDAERIRDVSCLSLVERLSLQRDPRNIIDRRICEMLLAFVHGLGKIRHFCRISIGRFTFRCTLVLS